MKKVLKTIGIVLGTILMVGSTCAGIEGDKMLYYVQEYCKEYKV